MKKPWYFYVIVAFLIYVCAIASIVVPIFILTDKAEKNNGQKINEIYEKFSGIESSGDICCVTQQNYISCSMKEIHFDYYSINGRTDVIPNAYQSCDNISFCDYVYFTKNYLFFSYEFVYKKTISYLVFKTEWEASNHITFVASFDNIPRSTGSSPNMYDYDKDGFSFYYYYNTQRTDLYRYSVSESTFSFIGSVQDPPDLGKNFFIETSKMKKNDGVELQHNNQYHTTSFSSSCKDAYDTVVSNGFKRGSIYQSNNYSLCFFKYGTDIWKTATILAVFSYDWDLDNETFQGLYVVRNDWAFNFRVVF